MLRAIILNVILLSVVAPKLYLPWLLGHYSNIQKSLNVTEEYKVRTVQGDQIGQFFTQLDYFWRFIMIF
jgi:hypothetical protein